MCFDAPVPEEIAKEKAEPTTNVAIPNSSYRPFSDFCRRRRLSMRPTVARLIEWVMAQPPPVQSAILGVDDEMASSYAAVIQRIVDDLEGEEEFDESKIRVGFNPPPQPAEPDKSIAPRRNGKRN